MTEFDEDFMTKAQVDGVKELVDLTRNGYRVLFSSEVYGTSIYKLHHSRNGRTLMVGIGRYIFTIKEGERIWKRVIYDEDGTIIQPEIKLSVPN
jgi:hypothetical protein